MPEPWWHVLCDGKHPVSGPDGQPVEDEEPCLCPCRHRSGDIVEFVQAHLGLVGLMAADWHGGECAMRDDDAADAALQLAIAVPAVADEPCECAAYHHVRALVDTIDGLVGRYGPDHEVTRQIANRWSGSATFNPAWGTTD